MWFFFQMFSYTLILTITYIYVRNENLTYLVLVFSFWVAPPLPMNIFPIQGLTEDKCAYGRTQGVLLPVWNTKDCPASVFQMQMIWYCWWWWFDSSQRNVLRRQWSRFGEKIWQNLNYPFAISHVPFPSRQCHPCSPPTRIDANKIMGLPAAHEILHLHIWYHSFQ